MRIHRTLGIALAVTPLMAASAIGSAAAAPTSQPPAPPKGICSSSVTIHADSSVHRYFANVKERDGGRWTRIKHDGTNTVYYSGSSTFADDIELRMDLQVNDKGDTGGVDIDISNSTFAHPTCGIDAGYGDRNAFNKQYPTRTWTKHGIKIKVTLTNVTDSYVTEAKFKIQLEKVDN